MRLQDQIVKITQYALDDLCRAALAVPEDKQDWSPGGSARSVLSQMREIAASPASMLPILKAAPGAKVDPPRAKPAPESVEHCVEVARSEFGKLCQFISCFPDIRMDDEIRHPMGDDSILTMADALILPYWNLCYHLGQVNQIQLILGDTEMH